MTRRSTARRSNAATLEREITEEELRAKWGKSKNRVVRSMLAAREEYLKNGGVPLDIEGIRRLVAENRGGLRDDEE